MLVGVLSPSTSPIEPGAYETVLQLLYLFGKRSAAKLFRFFYKGEIIYSNLGKKKGLNLLYF